MYSELIHIFLEVIKLFSHLRRKFYLEVDPALKSKKELNRLNPLFLDLAEQIGWSELSLRSYYHMRTIRHGTIFRVDRFFCSRSDRSPGLARHNRGTRTPSWYKDLATEMLWAQPYGCAQIYINDRPLPYAASTRLQALEGRVSVAKAIAILDQLHELYYR